MSKITDLHEFLRQAPLEYLEAVRNNMRIYLEPFGPDMRVRFGEIGNGQCRNYRFEPRDNPFAGLAYQVSNHTLLQLNGPCNLSNWSDQYLTFADLEALIQELNK